MPEAHKLRGWYDNIGSSAAISSISGVRGGQSGGGSNALKTFAETKIENLGSGEKPDYYTVKAMVAMINKERALYMACPSQDCNKKVLEFTDIKKQNKIDLKTEILHKKTNFFCSKHKFK